MNLKNTLDGIIKKNNTKIYNTEWESEIVFDSKFDKKVCALLTDAFKSVKEDMIDEEDAIVTVVLQLENIIGPLLKKEREKIKKIVEGMEEYTNALSLETSTPDGDKPSGEETLKLGGNQVIRDILRAINEL